MSKRRYVPSGCYLTCDKGSSPCQLKVTHHNHTKLYGEFLANEADMVPGENIFPMGACGLTNAPCEPDPLYWDKTMKAVKVKGFKLLVEDAKLICRKGGKVSIQFTRKEAHEALGIGGLGGVAQIPYNWLDFEHVVDSRQKAMVYDVETGKRSLEKAENPGDRRRSGNYGEAKQDLYMRGAGNKAIHNDPVIDIDTPTKTGIDGVYQDPQGRFIIADAKYNTAKLQNTKHNGRQMSEKWIEANLESAVGRQKAKAIIRSKNINSQNVENKVTNTLKDGNINVYEVDQNGIKVQGTDRTVTGVGKPATLIESVRQSLRSSVENSRAVNALSESNLAQTIRNSQRVMRANQWLARNAKSVSAVGKGVGAGTVVIGLVLTGMHLKEAYEKDGGKFGENFKEASFQEAGGWTGALIAGEAGAEIGAVIGTAICPGLGTAIGGVAGGIIGGCIGYSSGNKIGSFMADLF